MAAIYYRFAFHITVKRWTVLYPPTLLPTPDDGEKHNCSPRPDLQETPLPNADLELFVDGSATRNPETGKSQAGFALATARDPRIAPPLLILLTLHKQRNLQL